MKSLLAISAVILVLAMLFFRLHSESGLMELASCKAAVGQAKSWTIESTSQHDSPSFATFTTRNKVSCPDDYEYLSRSRTHDDVITEQSTITLTAYPMSKPLTAYGRRAPLPTIRRFPG